MMKRTIALLGVPFLNSRLEDIIAECVRITSMPLPHLHHSHYAAIINASDIAAIHASTHLTVKHPELLETYRNAQITVASGKMLFLLAKLLGSPLQEDISASKLLASLAVELGKKKKGVFLLGPSEKLAKATALGLHDLSPGLRIVGIASPHIYVEGIELASAPDRDALAIEQINASNADLLIITVDSSRNAIWIARIQRHIRPPLALGINNCNTLANSSSGKKKNASQTPEQTWKRWGKEIKFACLTIPLVIYHNLNRLGSTSFTFGKGTQEPPRHSLLFLSPQRTIAVIYLPAVIDNTNVPVLINYFEEIANHDILVLDFRWVRHIQPEGFGLLIAIWEQRDRDKRELYGFSPSWRVKQLMKLHRVWDLLNTQICFSPEMLIARLSHGSSSGFFDSIYQQDTLVVINFFGSLGNRLDYETYLKTLMPILGQKDCVIDLSYCTFVSNRGFSFLLNMKKMLHHQGNSLTLCSLTNAVREQFRTVKLADLFTIVKNVQMIR